MDTTGMGFNTPRWIGRPLTHITPVSLSDGATFERKLDWVYNYITSTLLPELDGKLDEWYEQYKKDLADQLAAIDQIKNEWQALFDQFMADVVARLEALNDQAMANLVKNSASLFYQALLESYTYGARVDDHGIAGAVDKAYANKSLVYISGENPVTESIPNLWNVEFIGSGTITRGGYTFIPNPKPNPLVHTNHIFVNAQTGGDGFDGLTPDKSIKTLAKVQNILRGLSAEQAAGAKWEVHLSGTFPNGQRMYNLPDFPLTVVFSGDTQVNGAPVTKIENTTASSPIGLWFEKCPATVYVNDIWFDGFNSYAGYGVLGKGNGDLRVNDCKFTNCSIGYSAIKNMDFSFKRNRTDSTVGIGSNAQYNSSGTWDECYFDGTPYAINVTRNVVCHIDYCHIYGATRGVIVEMSSRANIMESHFKRNEKGVSTQGSGEWLDTNNKFYAGTVDSNTIDSENNGVGRESRLYSQTSKNEYHFGSAWRANSDYLNPKVISGTGNQLVYAGTAIGKLPANWFKEVGKKLRVVVWGRTTAATVYSANVTLRVLNPDGSGNSILATGTIRGGTNGSFKIEFDVWARATAKQNYLVNTVAHVVEPSVYEGTSAVSFADEKVFRLYCEPAGINDSFQFMGMDTYLMG